MNGRKGKSMARKHTAAETNAYYSGMGYAVAYCGKGITFRKDNKKKIDQAGRIPMTDVSRPHLSSYIVYPIFSKSQ